MQDFISLKHSFHENGFAIVNQFFTKEEIASLLQLIESADDSNPAFRKSSDLFAIRRFLEKVPGIHEILFAGKLNRLIDQLFGVDFFVVKSIYFDKPVQSNWFVGYHQDLTISVNKKAAIEGYQNWTVKQEQFAVQPPLDILQNICTIRIHLDAADQNNGALKVIPSSHTKGICRPETISSMKKEEIICEVEAGGIMLMSSLLLHASDRTAGDRKRRVIHIEFADRRLPDGLNWSEYKAR